MKRLIALSVAMILVFAATATMLVPTDANAIGDHLFGLPLGIDFGSDDLVSSITVQVNRGWLNSDNFTMAISIDGLNHGDHSHGYQEVALSATEVLGSDRSLAYVNVDWNTDKLTPSTPEAYTACVQILVNGKPVGEPMCAWVGNF